ncbi:uncharacterized protein [Spinacia oleracea]|uniref:Uncharacterized protein n=1 Tax=Spinacia oleracea TaxID=3562 RepID=A0ABM3RIZ1_SPIOL|nr:uncharacterized protein LOC130470046 [Spinacia oleracea]
MEYLSNWAVKEINIDLDAAGEERLLQLNELDELRFEAYKNHRLYKEKMKKFHDRMIKKREFNVGDKEHGAIEVASENGTKFKVNGQRLKLYTQGAFIGKLEMIYLSDPPTDSCF